MGNSKWKKWICCLLVCSVLLANYQIAYTQITSKQKADLTIATVEQWNAFAERVANGENFVGKKVKLTADINLDGTQTLRMIGEAVSGTSANKGFNGIFDGSNYSVRYSLSGMSDKSGLFAKIGKNGVVENLNILNSKVEGYDGGLLCGLNYGIIRNCSACDSQITGKSSAGICYGNAGIIEWCYTDNCEIAGVSYVGGITALERGIVRNCYCLNNTITLDMGDAAGANGYCGGIAAFVGKAGDDNIRGIINNCYVSSNIKATGVSGTFYKGLVAGGFQKGSETNCYCNDDAKIEKPNGRVGKEEYVSKTNVLRISSDILMSDELLERLNKGVDDTSIKMQWVDNGVAPGFTVRNEICLKKVKNGYTAASCDYASKGKKITVAAVPNKGYRVSKVKVIDARGKQVKLTKVNSKKYTFVMPESNVTIQASMKKNAAK